MKKYIVAILLSVVSTMSFSQTNNNIFAERADLIRKMGTSQSFSMGWYSDTLSNNTNDIREINENYLGLSNYLSSKINNLVVLETIKSDRIVAEEALKGNFDILYTSSLIGSQLVSLGWKPLVERSESFTPVVLALKTNKKINTEKDFSKSKILGSNGTIFTYISYSLSALNLLDINMLNKNQNFTSKNINNESLINKLNTQQVDGIIVRDIVAEKLINESDKYKIVYKGQSSPGNIILINPKVEISREDQLKNIFLSLNNIEKNSNILKAIDSHRIGMEVFKNVSNDNIKLSTDVFNKTKQVPLKNNTK